MHAARVKSAKKIPARRDGRSGAQQTLALEVAKGFAIVLVVLGQCLDGMLAGNLFPQSVLWPGLTVYVLYSFAVPTFFVVAGALAVDRQQPMRVWLGRLMTRLAWPYLLWSAVQWGVVWYTRGHGRTALPQLARILWLPPVPYWFLYALFFSYLLYLVTRRRRPWVQILLALAFFVAPLFFEEEILDASLVAILQVTRGFLLFTLGAVLAAQIRQLGRWAAVLTTLVFAALAVVYYQAQLTGPVAVMLMVPVSVAGVVAALAWARELAAADGGWAGRMAHILGFLGRYAMSIYVMQIFFIAVVRMGLQRHAVLPAKVLILVEIVAATVAGILGPLAVHWLASRIHADQWLGLRPMRRAEQADGSFSV